VIDGKRVSIRAGCRMVSLQGDIIPIPQALLGWLPPRQQGGVWCVVLDDKREVLVHMSDVSDVADG
jgi:hypothetical protein